VGDWALSVGAHPVGDWALSVGAHPVGDGRGTRPKNHRPQGWAPTKTIAHRWAFTKKIVRGEKKVPRMAVEGPINLNATSQFQGCAQGVVDACLPAFTRRTQCGQDVSIQTELDRLFG